MAEKENNKIELRSEEIQDILGQVPHWIIRWGTIVVLATVLIILAGSYLYKYPDVQRAPITVTTEHPPQTLVARTDGQIASLFVSDSQFVRANTVLAVIENPASYSDVISLKFDLAQLSTIMPTLGEDEYIPLHGKYSLGDIQGTYAEFVSRYQDYYQFLRLDYYTKTIQSKRDEVGKYRQYVRRLRNESRIYHQDYVLASKQYSRDSFLFTQGAIAEADLDRSMQEKNNKQLAYEQSNTSQSETEIQISRINQEIRDLDLKGQEEKEKKQSDVRESYGNLVTEIDIWEQKYVLKAQIDGTVTFPSYWSKNQNVREGDRVLTIVPADPGEIIGKLNLPAEGAGKVKPGQRVNIQFANFPHLEYGMVKGIIRSISLVPYDNQYSVEVTLPDGLTTYYGREIPFTQEMPGRAEIITDDRRLIERIISPIRSMLTKQRSSKLKVPN
jgi:multidrug resistance efflux pump